MTNPIYDSTQAVQTGTTIMAVMYNGGVVMGADSRTSTGNYVANRVTDKITSLADNIHICRSGSAADTQALSDHVRTMLHQHSIQLKGMPQVKTAANLAMQIAYNNKNMLQAGLIVAGWDETDGPSVWSIPLGGSLLKVPFTIGGSGSAYILGWCDQAYRPDFTREECEAFVVKAVSLAMARDGSSGGMIRTLTITDQGTTRNLVRGTDLPLGYDEFHPQAAPVAMQA